MSTTTLATRRAREPAQPRVAHARDRRPTVVGETRRDRDCRRADRRSGCSRPADRATRRTVHPKRRSGPCRVACDEHAAAARGRLPAGMSATRVDPRGRQAPPRARAPEIPQPRLRRDDAADEQPPARTTTRSNRPATAVGLVRHADPPPSCATVQRPRSTPRVRAAVGLLHLRRPPVRREVRARCLRTVACQRTRRCR